ncbi:MAG: hypothetical protein QUV05_18640 [Phycisphaerae bacterium]|nr:hypothetical protein [Phycisphaerae bacterium]
MHTSVRNRLCRSDRRFLGMTLLGLGALTLATGCQQGYRWDLGDVVKAEQRARDEGKILFIFYQLWTDPTSNRMKGRELLSAPEVEAEFRDTINVLVDRDFGSMYVGSLRKYQVTSYPAFILVSPDGKYRSLTGAIPQNQFLEWVRDFKSRTSPPTSPLIKPIGK